MGRLEKTPTIPPPPGVKSNFSHPASNAKPLVVVGSMLLALTLLFIVNRAWMKTRVIRKCSGDDCEHMNAVTVIVRHSDKQ